MTKHFIKEQYDAQDADATKIYSKGESREDYADAWQHTGNVVLVGLKGSGKNALANALAERTGLAVMTPTSADEAVTVLGGNSTIVVLDDVLVEDPAVQPHIHDSGKVFYLMADSRTLASQVAERDSVAEQEQSWRDLSARLAVMEPMFYGVLHFILQATARPEELVEDAMEKIAF